MRKKSFTIGALAAIILFLSPVQWLCAQGGSDGALNGQAGTGSAPFTLDGEIIGLDRGTVVLWYNDGENKFIVDSVELERGRFHFSGTINGACEGLLWSDGLGKHNRDDSTVLRFILQPGKGTIYFKVSDPLNPLIKGLPAESEKQKWDRDKSLLLDAKRRYFDTILLQARLLRTDSSSAVRDRLNQTTQKYDSIQRRIRVRDMQYVGLHPDSYVSAYLLNWHQRRVSVDSVQRLYTALPDPIKKSTLGHIILTELYPLTDDNEFRKANPLLDENFDQRLQNLHSVYDLSLPDSSGQTISLRSLKSKYIVIDFWASWCKPCIENIPALKQMEKEYPSDSVQFISISLDKDKTAWKKAIQTHQFTGIQLSDPASFNSLAAIYCKALWAPTYVVADENGQIVKYNAPQAVDPELKILLDHLLKPTH